MKLTCNPNTVCASPPESILAYTQVKSIKWGSTYFPWVILQRAWSHTNMRITEQARGRCSGRRCMDGHPFVPPSKRHTQAHPSSTADTKPNHSQQEYSLGSLREASSWVALSSRLVKTPKAQCDQYCHNLHVEKCAQSQIPGTRSYWVVLRLLILTRE